MLMHAMLYQTVCPGPDLVIIVIVSVSVIPRRTRPKPESGGRLRALLGVPSKSVAHCSGIIRQSWSDTEKISMAPAQG